MQSFNLLNSLQTHKIDSQNTLADSLESFLNKYSLSIIQLDQSYEAQAREVIKDFSSIGDNLDKPNYTQYKKVINGEEVVDTGNHIQRKKVASIIKCKEVFMTTTYYALGLCDNTDATTPLLRALAFFYLEEKKEKGKEKAKHRAFLEFFVVHEGCRNNGLGSLFLAGVIQFFSLKKVDDIKIFQTTEEGLDFYVKMGFKLKPGYLEDEELEDESWFKLSEEQKCKKLNAQDSPLGIDAPLYFYIKHKEVQAIMAKRITYLKKSFEKKKKEEANPEYKKSRII